MTRNTECCDCEFVETDDSTSSSCDSECSCCCSCDEQCEFDSKQQDDSKVALELQEQLTQFKNVISDFNKVLQQQNQIAATTAANTANVATPIQHHPNLNDEINEIEAMLARHELYYNQPPTTQEYTQSATWQTPTTFKSGFQDGFNQFLPDYNDQVLDLAALHQELVSLDLFTYMYIVEQVLDEATRRELAQDAAYSPCARAHAHALETTCLDVQEHL